MSLAPTFWALTAGAMAYLATRSSRIGFSAIFLAALAAASTPRGTDPNEVAGTLAPVVPILFALAASTRRPGPRIAGLLLGLAGLARLLATESRGGILAVLVGLVVLLALEGRRGRLGLGILGVGALVAGAIFGRESLVSSWISGGSAKGWTLENLLTGRPEIWQRATWIVEDLPALGIGPGRFDEVVAAAYPLGPEGAPAPADAHQFFLQLAVDLGLPGALLVAFFVLVSIVRLARALRLASSTSDRPSERRLFAGVAGGLAAWLVFGLADAVALGTPGALVGAGLVGLAYGSAPAGPSTKSSKLVGLALALTLLVALLPHDLENRQTLREIVANPTGEAASAEQRFVTLEPERLDLLVALSPTDVDLARRAVRRWPTQARAWAWLGNALRDHDDEGALDVYLRAAALDPRDGHVWLSIGQLRERKGSLLAALDAYETACRRGDPGANACGAGGRLAESLGQVDRARSLYLRSRWPPFRSRAESLR